MERETPDSAELDAIIDLEAHPGYLLVVDRIADEINRSRNALESPKDLEETAQLRGYIKALRMVTGIPQILKEELRKEQVQWQD